MIPWGNNANFNNYQRITVILAMKSRAKGNQFKPFFLETCGPSAKSSRLSEETTKEILKKLKTADDGSTKCMGLS